jgi:hypothetical protein
MADLIDREPNDVLKDLLISEWPANATTQGYDADAHTHTGWFDDNHPHVQISVTPESETHNYTAFDPTGAGLVGDVDGVAVINVWVPYFRDTDDPRSQFDSAGIAKDHRFQLKMQCWSIIHDNQQGTTHNGERELRSLEVGTPQDSVEDDEDYLVFRSQMFVGYEWEARP